MHKSYCSNYFLSLISKLSQITDLINEFFGLETLAVSRIKHFFKMQII